MKVAAIVLAAGVGQRFGSATKQLAVLDGKPLVRHGVDAALAAGVDEVVVVLGHAADAIEAVLPPDPRVRTVTNPRYAEGQSTSVVAGIASLDDDTGTAIVLLADQPGVSPRAIQAVVDAVEQGADVARADYDDQASHPVAFAREVWPSLRQLRGDAGARQLLSRFDIESVPIPGPAPRDIDEPVDLP